MRIEALLRVTDGPFVCERLGNPAYPQNVGKLRCVGGRSDGPAELPAETIMRELLEEFGITLCREDISSEIPLFDRIGVRRFKVAVPADVIGRCSIEQDGTQLVAIQFAEIPIAWSYDDWKQDG